MNHPRKFDFLPWSFRSRLRRQLHDLEQNLWSVFPLELWSEVQSLDDDGRRKLAPILGTASRWVNLSEKWNNIKGIVDEVDGRFHHLKTEASNLKLQNISKDRDLELWKSIIIQCEETHRISAEAETAWESSQEKEMVEDSLKSLAREWHRLARDVPLKENWRKGQGHLFDEVLEQLAHQVNLETLSKVRGIFYTGNLKHLLKNWKKACVNRQLKHLKKSLESLDKRIE